MDWLVAKPVAGSVQSDSWAEVRRLASNAQRETQCWSRLEAGAAELPAGT
jgi:hypothetical protein